MYVWVLQQQVSLIQAAFASSTPQKLKGHNEIHVEGLGEISSIVSHTLKERGNVRTNPSLFRAAIEDFVASSPKYEEDVLNR
jgi:hypothetical protein